MSLIPNNFASRTRASRLLLYAVTCVLSFTRCAVALADDRDPHTWLGGFFRLDQRAVALDAEYYGTSQGQRNNIRVQVVEGIRSWSSARGLELQMRGGLFHSEGARNASDIEMSNLTSGDSRATGVIGGGAVRLYPLKLGAARLFAEGSVQILYTSFGSNSVFPAGGTGVNGFLRAGAGVAFDVSPRLTVEAAYHLAHVSNGSGLTPQNPMWNGSGGGLAIRRRF